MAYCEDHHTLVTASADMTLLQWYLDDIPSIKHYTIKSRWPTKHAAMSMCWSSSHRLLYSGTTAGTIQGTRCEGDVLFVILRFFPYISKILMNLPNLLDLKLSIKVPSFTGIWRCSGLWRHVLHTPQHSIFRAFICGRYHNCNNPGVGRYASTQPIPQKKRADTSLSFARLGHCRAARNGDVEGTLGYRHGNDGHARARQPGFG